MQSKILLPNMSGKIDFIGEPVKAIGYDSIKTNKRSQTICLYTTNFVGRFWLQGSLKDEPKEDLDWFVIPLTEETPYVEMNNFSMNLVKHDNRIYNVNGNYMWLRGKVDRKSYLHIIDQKTRTVSKAPSVTAWNVDWDSTNGQYIPTPLEPKYDPEYYEGWDAHYDSAYTRSIMSYHLGNIEKVILCY